MTTAAASRHLVRYAALQAAAIAAFFFVPLEARAHALWQVLVGWAAAVAILAVRPERRPGAAAWYLFAAGVFLNAGGILVAALSQNPAQTVGEASVVDAFWLALFPALAAGMAVLIRHRSAERDWASLVDAAIVTTGFAVISWVFLIGPAATDPRLGVLGRATAVAYPIGDLVILGMMVRIVVGGGIRNGAFRLIVAALLSFLATDVGWAALGHTGAQPGPLAQRFLESGSMLGYALFGAAALHPSAARITETRSRSAASLRPGLLAGLTLASLTAPAILAFEVARHDVADGGAIALGAAVLFLLVIARMALLVRRVEERTRELDERNRAMRRVLDTVNEGLLRVSRDAMLLVERSARIDRWFRPFDGPLPFVQYIREFDRDFAAHFQLSHDALAEGTLPVEVCLAQYPSRLCSRGRDYRVSYLPVADGDQNDGLLVVIEDVTEQVRSADQDAHQRDLLAMFQGFVRDRAGFGSFLEEANRIVEDLASPGAQDRAATRRLLHTLKGIASMVSLNLVAQLCHRAEDALDEGPGAAAASIEAIRGRWVGLTGAFQMLVGDQSFDGIAVQAKDVDALLAEIANGLPSAAVARRLASWRDEPVERSFARLGNYARALSARLGKGDPEIVLEANGVRLDRERWAPLWSELVHVVRNAVDHGWESPDERRAAGKPSRPRLRLGARTDAHDLIIEVEDDGRGVDWGAIRRVAAERGVPARTREDLVGAVLSAGVSEREEAGPVSGRGVGMAAVASRVDEYGGRIEADSREGRGTCWRLSFPLPVLGADAQSSMMRQKATGGILASEEAGADRDRKCVE